jgi:precorrin-3B synthase
MIRTRKQDACPGTLRAHSAADGDVARVRLPGGMISSAQLKALARVAMRAASQSLELTSRSGLQLRGITDLAAVVEAAIDAGLLPSVTHDRVRNIVSSPLSGRSGGLLDVRPWVGDLDAAIQGSLILAGLPGRFLFSIDDGRGDTSGVDADVGVRVMGDDVALLVAGADTGIRLDPPAAVPAMITVAKRFAEERGASWRIREMPDQTALLTDFPARRPPGLTMPSTSPSPVGWIEQDDGRIAVGAAVPFGVLPAGVAIAIAEFDVPLVITPWRSVLICDLDGAAAVDALRTLAPMGLVFDKQSPWLNVSACIGTRGCRHAVADVRADAAEAVATTTGPTHRQHWVGCSRACGSPPIGDVLIATDGGYRVLETRNVTAR